MIPEQFIYVGTALAIYGGLSYLVDTVKGRVKPNRVTWFLWALAPLIAFAAEVKQGVGMQAMLTFIVGFNPLMIFIASFVNKKSKWEISKLDIICAVISLLGIVFWALTRVGNIAIAFSILADAVAGVPTIVKSYKAPETESYKPFFFAAINALITLFTITVWTFAHYAFPLIYSRYAYCLFCLSNSSWVRRFRNGLSKCFFNLRKYFVLNFYFTVVVKIFESFFSIKSRNSNSLSIFRAQRFYFLY